MIGSTGQNENGGRRPVRAWMLGRVTRGGMLRVDCAGEKRFGHED